VTEYAKEIKSFQDLEAWKEGRVLARMIYTQTNRFPKEEVFGLTNQMRRCVISITSNIAEGFNRFSTKEKVQFYSVSLGSTAELQSQLVVALDVGYTKNDAYTKLSEQAEKVHKITTGLIKHTRSHR
jgi:four helix bundle protein